MPKLDVVGGIKKRKKPKLNAQQRALKAADDAMLKRHGIDPKAPKKRRKFEPLKALPMAAVLAFHEDRSTASFPSVGPGVQETQEQRLRYEGEMAAREAAAREVKHTVAPAYNKGGLQYIHTKEDLLTAGRKV